MTIEELISMIRKGDSGRLGNWFFALSAQECITLVNAYVAINKLGDKK